MQEVMVQEDKGPHNLCHASHCEVNSREPWGGGGDRKGEGRRVRGNGGKWMEMGVERQQSKEI